MPKAKAELQDNVTIVCQDITNRPLDVKVDLVMSAMAMHHVEDTAQLVESFKEHLNPGGMLALADLDAEDGSFHPPDVEGVFHHGFKRDAVDALLFCVHAVSSASSADDGVDSKSSWLAACRKALSAEMVPLRTNSFSASSKVCIPCVFPNCIADCSW